MHFPLYDASLYYVPYGNCRYGFNGCAPGYIPWYRPYGYATSYGAGSMYGGVRAPQPEHKDGPERVGERQPHADHVDWASQFPREVILHGPSVKEVALTFDDGPDDHWTPRVLDALRDAGVKATFFCVGQRVQANPEVFRRILREGHIVGNHSWNHANLARIPLNEATDQIVRTNDEMHRVADVRPHLLRPPYGALSEPLIREATRLGMIIILWNVDSLDWTQIPAEQVAVNMLAHTGPGAIILQHSAGGEGQSLQNTVDALPRVISTLRNRGYAFRSVPELLKIPAYNK